MPRNLLTSPLDAPALQSILARHPRKPLLPPMGDPHWKRIAANPLTAGWIAPLSARAEQECAEPLPELTDALYADFALTGRRLPFEAVYFERRRRLSRAAVSLLFCDSWDRRKDRLVTSVISKLTAILDETSWALPAHVGGGPEGNTGKDPCQIDLFCAETANLMAELLDLVGAILPSHLVHRIRERLTFLFGLYLEEPFFWKKITNNWNAVCHQGILGAALSQQDDLESLTRMLLAARDFLPAFLDGYGPDGGSSEGAGYWEYGFGFFAVLNQQLETRTGGELSLFEGDPHLLEIARFGPRILLPGSNLVNFADSNRTGGLAPWLLAYLGARLNESDCTAFAHQEYRRVVQTGLQLDEERADLFHFVRLLLSCPERLTAAPPVHRDCFLPDLGVMVTHGVDLNGHQWDFAAKAGHNGEHHNHNDCGSFILNIDGIRLVTEIGVPEYVAAFFSPQRYEFLAARTLGHSLPIINGCEQSDGAERASKVIAHTLNPDQATLVIDTTACYPAAAACAQSIRSFCFEKRQGRLLVEDRFQLRRMESLESAVITVHPIVIQANEAEAEIQADRLTLTLCAAQGTRFVRVETHAYRDHNGVPAQIYRLVIAPEPAASAQPPGTTLWMSYSLEAPQPRAFAATP